jgi:hypothetical protein
MVFEDVMMNRLLAADREVIGKGLREKHSRKRPVRARATHKQPLIFDPKKPFPFSPKIEGSSGPSFRSVFDLKENEEN